MNRTGLEFNLSLVFLQNKNSSYCHLDITQVRLTSATTDRRANRGCAYSTDYVKSIPPTTENWLRKLYNYSMNINTSTEDKHETNHINNKYNETNTDTRKLHNL